MNLKINPSNIEIPAFPHSFDVTLSGNFPAGSQIVVKLEEADDSSVRLAKKGKEGIFWLNKHDVKVSGMPSFYRIVSPAEEVICGPDCKKN